MLIGSVPVVRSLQHARSLRLGFEPRHAASVSYDMALGGCDEARGREFQRPSEANSGPTTAFLMPMPAG
jgi:hypothetical protein